MNVLSTIKGALVIMYSVFVHCFLITSIMARFAWAGLLRLGQHTRGITVCVHNHESDSWVCILTPTRHPTPAAAETLNTHHTVNTSHRGTRALTFSRRGVASVSCRWRGQGRRHVGCHGQHPLPLTDGIEAEGVAASRASGSNTFNYLMLEEAFPPPRGTHFFLHSSSSGPSRQTSTL